MYKKIQLQSTQYMWANAIQHSAQITFNAMSSTSVENGESINEFQCEQCPVCYDDLHIKNVINLPCNHQMCKGCYYSWTDGKGKNSCPCCRDSINKTNESMHTQYTRNRERALQLEEELDILVDDCRFYIQRKETLRLLRNEQRRLLEEIRDEHSCLVDTIDANIGLFPGNSNTMTEFQLYKYFKDKYVHHVINSWTTVRKHLKSLFNQLPSDPPVSAILSKVCFRTHTFVTDDTLETDIFGTLFDDEPEEEYEDPENIRDGIAMEPRLNRTYSERSILLSGQHRVMGFIDAFHNELTNVDSISEIIDLTEE